MKKFLLLVALLVIVWLVYSYVWVPYQDRSKVVPPTGTPGGQVNPPVSNEPPTDGVVLFEKGKYKEAARKLEEEIAAGKATAPGRHLTYIAMSYDKTEQPEKALKAWERIISEYPDDEYCGDAYYEIGRRSKDRADKIKHLETAMNKYPQSQGGKAAGLELGEYYLGDGTIPDREFKARKAFSMALRSSNLPKDKTAEVKKKLESLNKKLVFSSFQTPDSTIYTVATGDNIDIISRKFKVVPPGKDVLKGHIKRINGLTGDLIFPGDNLKIITGEFRIGISKADLALTLYINDDFLKEYRVGLGSPDKTETPFGEFHIAGKVVSPPWTKRFDDGHQEQIPFGDPRNILGTRWMGFKEKPRLGIHGTTKPESIGQFVSDGCIRMLNADVEELYDLVPEGAKVIIE